MDYKHLTILLALVLVATALVAIRRELYYTSLKEEVHSARRKLSETIQNSAKKMEGAVTRKLHHERRQPPRPPFPYSDLDHHRSSHRPPLSGPQMATEFSSHTLPSKGFSSNAAFAGGGADEYVVKKDAESDDLRLVFFAGIEGTGHHFWQAVLEDPAVSKRAYFDSHECGVASLLWQIAKAGPGLCNRECRRSRGSETMLPTRHDLASYLAKLKSDIEREARPGPKVVPLNVWKSRGTVPKAGNSRIAEESRYGMLSFPNYGEPNKGLKHPNLRLLAEAAEKARIDLRVIVLLRNSKAVLASTSKRASSLPGFALPLGREAAILADNTAVLLAQLLLIDPGFFVCVEMDSLDSDAFNSVGKFTGLKYLVGESAWSLQAFRSRGLKTPPPRDSPTRGQEFRTGSQAGQARSLEWELGLLKARALEPPGSDSRALEGYEPLTEDEATGPLADLMAMELLFRKKVCGL
mmetsp:Transcript_5738/g.13272  ORF Transcript_5738/g.13272 Transcript_5738/m.13272 type:complete len:466 (-) Transcript_5738:154-1551(-)